MLDGAVLLVGRGVALVVLQRESRHDRGKSRPMETKRSYYSLRFKIAMGLLLSVVVVLAVTSGLRYISFRRLLLDSLVSPIADAGEILEAQLAAYLRSRLVLSISSIVVILVISDLMMRRMVVGRLKQFLGVVKQVHPEDLNARVRVGGLDEITELAEAFNQMTEDLQRQTEGLSSLNALAATVSQSLNLREVLRAALDEVLRLMHLRAGWIVLRSGNGEDFRLAATRGLPREVMLAHAECNWKLCVCSGVFESGQSQVFHDQPMHPCPAAEYLQAEGFVARVCVSPSNPRTASWA